MEVERKKRQVAIYMNDWQCLPGTGGHLRLRSDVTAFHDLGWQVEVVRLESTPAPAPKWAGALGVNWVTEAGGTGPGRVAKALGRIQYRLGIPGKAACGYYFPEHSATLEAVARRRGQGRLHFFEGIQLASAVPFLSGEAAIFSHIDVWHEATAAALAAQLDMEGRGLRKEERRELRFLKNIEDRVCGRSAQILTISARDCAVLQRQGWTHAYHLPMSIGEIVPVDRTAGADGLLHILHLGKISHLPSYRSLEHLLRDVFPLLEPETLSRLRLRVVGTIDDGNPRTARILQLSEPYAKQVDFVGFVPDLQAEFTGNDLQIVASTAASGLQTRIVESLARGLPVLASETAAQGLESLRSGEDIIIARTAREFAGAIRTLADNRNRIDELSVAGLRFYERRHSRKHVAERLRSYLSRMPVL